MKTLDEVIKALRCTDPEVDPETKCKDCPYKESHINELWYVGPSCLDEMFADALHYLKEYQDMIKKLENCQKENQRLKKRVEKLESDAAWDADYRRGQVQGMW